MKVSLPPKIEKSELLAHTIIPRQLPMKLVLPAELLDEQACYRYLLDTLRPYGLCCPAGHSLPASQQPHRHTRAPVVDYRCKQCKKVFEATHRSMVRAMSDLVKLELIERDRPNALWPYCVRVNRAKVKAFLDAADAVDLSAAMEAERQARISTILSLEVEKEKARADAAEARIDGAKQSERLFQEQPKHH